MNPVAIVFTPLATVPDLIADFFDLIADFSGHMEATAFDNQFLHSADQGSFVADISDAALDFVAVAIGSA